ncbi:hypothetical protein KCG52_01125 [Neisseria subflava]|uniref:hypothetical protein n=1 Tax=Neisseria subflava TaxID=28449 RepID=UPI0020B82D7A|nr:hypothetical protein [Neisseria subflava]UTG67954.1 hypothetical protein KCG52_01125 [Neisseria subflava]
MKQWSINIPGNYLDSFIYMGILFLFDFDGKINVFNFENMLNKRLDLENDQNKKREFQSIFSRQYEKNRKSKQYNKNLEIDSNFLEQFRTDEFDIGEWVTDVNITSKNVYFSSSKGVQKKRFFVDEHTPETYGKFNKEKNGKVDLFLDTKVYSIASSAGRTVLCCGDEGAIYGLEQNSKFTYIKDNKSDNWIDCQWYSLSNRDILSINSQKVITEQEMKLEKTIQETKNRIFKIKKIIREKKYSKQKEIEKTQKINEIMNSFESNLHQCYSADLEKESKLNNMKYFKQKNLKNIALFFQLNNEILCKLNCDNGNIINHKIVSDGEITNWRIFPNARTHFNQLHIIYDDYMSINGFEINFPKLQQTGKL